MNNSGYGPQNGGTYETLNNSQYGPLNGGTNGNLNTSLYGPQNGGLYSAPPPPLPYRPPPPNPYLNSDADQYARILPKNPQVPSQPQSQPQFTISTTPTLATPPESEMYARVSNLKKVNSSNGSSPQRNVRFADEQSSSGVTSTSSSSSR